MSMMPCCQVCASQDQKLLAMVPVCLWAPRLQVLGACKGLPKFQAAGRSSAFLHREEVAVQRCGVTAGAEVHNCLGAVGRLQRKRELCAWSGDTVPIGHISFLRVGSRS